MQAILARRLHLVQGQPPPSRDQPTNRGRAELPPIQCVQATEWDDVHAAFGLLYRSYLKRELIRPNKSQLRYTHYNLLPESATFVAKIGARVVGTLSAIVEMPPFGLPMETLYGDEIAVLRGREGKLAEGSGLAVDPEFQPIGMSIVMTLVRHAITYARKLGATCAAVACHPRHVRFYERMFLFERFGDLRTYHAVNDAPAVALRLDLRNLEEAYRAASSPDGDGIYRFFFSDEILRRPDTPVRAGAFPKDVSLRLCEKLPAVVDVLEAGAPGLVRRITGEDPLPSRPCHDQDGGARDWDTYPIFVAA